MRRVEIKHANKRLLYKLKKYESAIIKIVDNIKGARINKGVRQG